MKGGRARKATKQGRVPRNPSGIRKPQQTSTDEEETVVSVDMGALSRMLDAKLAAQYKKIMKGVSEWFVSNTLISFDNVKDGTPHNGKGVAGFNGKEKRVSVSRDHPIPIFEEDEDFESLFLVCPLVRRPARVVQAANRDTKAPVEGLRLENSVDVIASFYNGCFPGDCSESRAAVGHSSMGNCEENDLDNQLVSI